jgi:hypothetical protein
MDDLRIEIEQRLPQPKRGSQIALSGASDDGDTVQVAGIVTRQRHDGLLQTPPVGCTRQAFQTS